MIKNISKRTETRTMAVRSGNRACLILGMLLLASAAGCASTHKTTKTEKTVTYPNKGMVYQGSSRASTDAQASQGETELTETTETTVTTTDTKVKRPGLLGSTLHAVGYVISLPFIIVGGLFRIIFGG